MSVPNDVVVPVVVDGDVVVHGRVGSGTAGAHAAKHARAENVHQGRSLRRRSDRAAQKLLRGVSRAVELFVGVATFNDGGALERDTGEEALGLGVGEDARNALEGGGTGGFGVAAYGAGGDGDIATEREGTGLGKGLDSAGVVENKDEIGELEADLATKTSAGGGDSGRGGPGAVVQAGDDKTATEASGTEETGLDYCENCEAL